jgi:RHS repeat-associated protein
LISAYRFGFNGKENDDEAYGDDNQQDYGMRVYDPRVGRFLSVDPLFKGYPWNSTYAFAENDVIRSVDLDGGEKKIVTLYVYFQEKGEPELEISTEIDLLYQSDKAVTQTRLVFVNPDGDINTDFGVIKEVEEPIMDCADCLVPAAMFDYSSDEDLNLKAQFDQAYIDGATTSADRTKRKKEIEERDKNKVATADGILKKHEDTRGLLEAIFAFNYNNVKSSKTLGSEKGKRAKSTDNAQEQFEGVDEAQKRAQKSRPSIKEGDWEGSKRKPSQRKIERTDKSKQREKHQNKRGGYINDEEN